MFAQAGQAVRPQRKPAAKTIVVTRHCPREMYRSNWSIEQFVLAKKIGGGYASSVVLAICKATGTQVAIKLYHRCKLSQLNVYQVQREIRIHSCLDHRNVLQLYAAFEDEAGVYLVTEYASRGDVFGELDRRGGSMTEADAVRQVLAPFLSALEYLHALNIIHRDIKPENLLFTATGVLKIADFGLSIDITQERPVTRVGTLDYMAPEVVICPDKCLPDDHKEKKHLHYTHLVDAWAVGVLAYELTVGRAPFDAGEKRKTMENILYCQPRFPAWISDGARHFVNFSLTKHPAKRPGIQQLAEHPWIHLHAGVPRSNPLNAGRAVSCHNLSMCGDPSRAAAAQPRHKLVEQAANSQQEKLGNLQEDDEDEVFVSATGEANGTAAEVATADISTITRPAAVIESLSEQQQDAAVAPPSATFAAQAGFTVVTKLPPVNTSPFAAVQPTVSAPSTNLLRGVPVLGAAADKLRAFVHRCQSANDIESLKAYMLQQPAEPSNACFEPGGRFYTGSPAAGAGAAAVATIAASSANAAALGSPRPAHVHDSAASLGSSCSSSSSSSRPADLPRGPSNTSVLMSPKPLQVVKLPASMCQQIPKSDSCKSLQGLSLIAEGKSEGKVSSLGGAPTPMSPNSRSGSLAGTGPGSLMPASPAAAVLDRRDTQDLVTNCPSTSSCSCSCSSSCESGLHGSSGSISSSHSWGYQQQQQGVQQYQAPQPPSPPCKLSRHAQNPFSPAAATHVHLLAGGSQQQQQDLAAAAGVHNSHYLGQSSHRTPSCKELEQLITMCKPGHAVPLNGATANLTGKRTLVNISADCRPLSQQQQQQQLVGPGEMLAQGPMDQTNGCFAFLKSPRR